MRAILFGATGMVGQGYDAAQFMAQRKSATDADFIGGLKKQCRI